MSKEISETFAATNLSDALEIANKIVLEYNNGSAELHAEVLNYYTWMFAEAHSVWNAPAGTLSVLGAAAAQPH